MSVCAGCLGSGEDNICRNNCYNKLLTNKPTISLYIFFFYVTFKRVDADIQYTLLKKINRESDIARSMLFFLWLLISLLSSCYSDCP